MTDTMTPIQIILRIAKIAEAIGAQAGVGGMETAGNIVSYLAKHPEYVDDVLSKGMFDLPNDWIGEGLLTYHALDGSVWHPDDAKVYRAQFERNKP